MHTLFYKLPLGLRDYKVLQASQASVRTSRELVHEEERDAAYFRSLEEHGTLLNQPQIEAVRHGDGPLLTLAGAGSGKTSVLVCRTGYLLRVRGVSPRSVLLITFSKKAAEEMRERVGKLPGVRSDEARAVEARTFHSFCLQLLRSRGYSQGILSETRFQHIFLKKLLRELGLYEAYQPETLLALLSSYKMQMLEVSELPERTPGEQELKQIFLRYEEWKQELDRIDFDDILLEAYKLLKRDETLLNALQKRFRYIMVDEFQDTNMVQYELIRMLAMQHRNLMVVGDDDQTIYSFNGAKNEYILQFDQQYPGAKTVTLDINYRSSASIVGLGNAVIEHNKLRKRKTLQATRMSSQSPQYITPKNTDDEAELVIEAIQEGVKDGSRPYESFAILYRSASSSRAVFEQLVYREIPFIDYGNGELFYDHWVIKPVLDYLRLTVNRRSFDAIEGVLPTLYLPRERAMAYIWHQEKVQAKKWPLIHLVSYPEVKEYQQEKVRERIKLIQTITPMRPTAAIQELRRSFYDQFLEAGGRHELTQHKDMLKEMLDEVESAARRFDQIEPFLSFIDELAKKHEEMEQRKNSGETNAVSLMTIHKSKGLEFPVVFLIGASEGILPHSSALEAEKLSDRRAAQAGEQAGLAALEEERRLAYVAITRAKEELYISSPAYYRGKKTEVSRFLLTAYRGEESPPGGGSRSGGGSGSYAAGTAGSGAGYGASKSRSYAAGSRAGGASSGYIAGRNEAGSRSGMGSASASSTAARSAHHAAHSSAVRGAAAAADSLLSAKPAAGGTVRVSQGLANAGEATRTAASSARPHVSHTPQAGSTQTIDVWLCSGSNCPTWQRVTSRDGDQARTKRCPLCQSEMTRGRKEVRA
ncbi:UvrD-helicase domain-containing protein [Paenibacillus sp. GCM10023252]|uniref:UvrD-helicase domain-containing protein n=1 Tax=Paenibacillus sp. GCM10023252 TaxID=3252649 RepID=UPI0036178B28